jgi:hypothetical protein
VFGSGLRRLKKMKTNEIEQVIKKIVFEITDILGGKTEYHQDEFRMNFEILWTGSVINEINLVEKFFVKTYIHYIEIEGINDLNYFVYGFRQDQQHILKKTKAHVIISDYCQPKKHYENIVRWERGAIPLYIGHYDAGYKRQYGWLGVDSLSEPIIFVKDGLVEPYDEP